MTIRILFQKGKNILGHEWQLFSIFASKDMQHIP